MRIAPTAVNRRSVAASYHYTWDTLYSPTTGSQCYYRGFLLLCVFDPLFVHCQLWWTTISHHWRKLKALTLAREYHPLSSCFLHPPPASWRKGRCCLCTGSSAPVPWPLTNITSRVLSFKGKWKKLVQYSVHAVENLSIITGLGNTVLFHFAWGVAEAKCILVTAVCVSVPRHVPTLLHEPRCKLGEW